MSTLFDICVSLLPIAAFLGALRFLDSFKLVSIRTVLSTILIGAGLALVSLFANSLLIERLGLSFPTYSRYVAPILEEVFKGAWVVFLIRTRRVGFIVDAAITGFAVGAGFAMMENVYYLQQLSGVSPLVWVLRGFGTAAMHGGSTAIFAIISKYLFERSSGKSVAAFIPGLLLAIGIHSAFNHFLLPPVIMTAVLVVCFPLLMVFVFERSEKATRHWLGEGFDSDMELWESLSSGSMGDSRIGRYLESLTARFDPVVVADMLCYLQLHTELAVQVKGVLLARQSGFKLPPDPDLTAKLRELDYLEHTIGRTGHLAIKPFFHGSHREIWRLRVISD